MNNQIKKINFIHSFIFFLFCNIFSFIFLILDHSVVSPLICLFLILSIGVSHGSLDHIKGKKLLKIIQINSINFFYLTYIMVALTVIALWLITPTISLIVFLVVASFHFGKEDTQFLVSENSYFNQLLFFFKGILIVLSPMYFHFDETVYIFKLLLVENEIFYSSLNFIESNKLLQVGIILSTISSIILFTKKFELKKFTIFFDYFSILILNYYFSPLKAFTMYFCFLHSIRHSITLMFELDKNNINNGFKIFIKKALPLTILTSFICLVGLYFLNNNYDFNPPQDPLIFFRIFFE